MNLKLLLTIIFGIFLCLSSAKAQETEIENLIESQTEFSDAHNLMEWLEELEKNPINLNITTVRELSLLPWISDVLAEKIIQFRTKQRQIRSIDELLLIEGFDPTLLPLLKKYLAVTSETSEKDISLEMKTRAVRKLELSEGLKNGYYYKSPTKLYNRLILNYGNQIRIGTLLEKDPGEKKLNDFSSYFFQFSSGKNGFSMLAGNYLLEFGQGLVFWNPYQKYKSNNPVYSAKKHARSAIPYTLVDENASLLGLSMQFCSKFYQIISFYSSQTYDATVDSATGYVLNFFSSGYHRNDQEEAKKDRLRENLFGGRIEIYPLARFSLGISGYHSHFNRDIVHRNPTLYRFAFQGRKNSVIGLDYNYTSGIFNLFGEFAQSKNKGYAILTGFILDSKGIDISIVYRNYSKNFNSLHGSGFGEHGISLQNEQGVYLGVRFSPVRILKFYLYVDQYKFPWRTYSIPMPAYGSDFLIGMKYKPIKKTWLYLQLKTSQRNKPLSVINEYERKITAILPRNQQNLRFQIDYKPLTSLTFRLRIEKNFVTYNKLNYLKMLKHRKFSGILLYQEVTYKWKKRAAISMRMTFFDSDDYESRLYQFERDIPGLLTNQMLYGQGTRWYIFAKYNISSFLKVYVKFSSTHYLFRTSIGSQADQIPGNQLNMINFQLEACL